MSKKQKKEKSRLVLKQQVTFGNHRLPEATMYILHGLMLFAWASAYLKWLDGSLDLQAGLPPVILAAAVFCLILEIAVRMNCLWRISGAACLIALVYIWFNRGRIWEGLNIIIYQAAAAISEYYHVELDMSRAAVNSEALLPVMLVLTGMLILTAGVTTAKWRIGTVAEILSLLLFVGSLAVDRLPSAEIAALLLIAVCGLVVLTTSEADRQTSVKCGLWVVSMLLVTVVISYLAANSFVAGKMHSYYEAIKEYPQRMIAAGQEFLSGKDNGESPIEKLRNLVSVNFSDDSGKLTNQAPVQTGTVVLEVNVSCKPEEPLYFRDSIGVSYNTKADRWEILKDAAFCSSYKTWTVSDQLTYEEVKKVLSMQLFRGLKEADITNRCNYKIANKSASDLNTWVPYGIDSSELTAEADGAFGTSLLTVFEGYQMIGSGRIISASDESWIDTRYRTLFEDYTAYVYDTYLEVPEDMPALREAYERLSQMYGDVSDSHWINIIQKELDNSCTYEKYGLENTPPGTNLIDDFYGRQKKGYCIHFASAGTMLLRMAGIPARYVNGYVAWPEDFNCDMENGGYTAEITGYRGHAWVEVYDAEAGAWLPVDMTPADSSGVIDNAPDTNETEEQTAGQSISESNTSEPETFQEETPGNDGIKPETGSISGSNGESHIGNNENTDESGKTKTVPIVPLVVSGVILAALAAVCIYLRQDRNKTRKFSQANRNKAVLSMEWHLADMMEKAGWKPESDMDDWAYAAWVQEKADTLEDGEYLYFMEKLHQAAYSEEMLTEEEYEKCQAVYRKIADKIREGKKGRI